MSRRIFNWSFNDVVRFLKKRGFYLNHVEGSHYFYVGSVNSQKRQVCVPFHGSKSLGLRVMKGIISQSGIPKEEWYEN